MNNTTKQRPTFVTHLECGLQGDHYNADELHGLSEAGKPLLVKYDLASLSQAISKQDLLARPADLWRYREFLPVRNEANIVSLGETMTPLIPVPRLGRGQGEVFVKDEGRLPTGSFKARGICLAISMAKELGVSKVAMPTNGNAGAALAAYATRAGIESYVFCPADTPEINVREIAVQGAKVWRVNGLINDIGWIHGPLPRMVAVQATGCAPIVRAYDEGKEYATVWEDAHTVAAGIRVPGAIGDFLILRAVRESNGFATAVSDESILAAQQQAAQQEGLLLCPEGAATLAGYEQELACGRIAASESVVLFNCATGLKYPMPPVIRELNCKEPVDYEEL